MFYLFLSTANYSFFQRRIELISLSYAVFKFLANYSNLQAAASINSLAIPACVANSLNSYNSPFP